MNNSEYSYKILISALLLLLIGSCSKDNNDIKSKDLNGEYEIIKASSSEEIDVNLDGLSSKNLLSEIPNLKYSYLKLISKGEGTRIYSQFWQNQFFQGPTDLPPINYDPSIIVGYLNQATVAAFIVKNDALILSKLEGSFPLPNSVNIVDINHIGIEMNKRIYTKSGFMDVIIEVLYQRKEPNF
jgi:hypothetical protein